MIKNASASLKSMVTLFDLVDNANNPDTDTNNDLQVEYTIGDRTIDIINTTEQLNTAMKEISKTPFISFDSEQKPTFKKGQKAHGISLIQLATQTKCYLIQTKQIDNLQTLINLLEDNNIIKVGTGLKGDNEALYKQFKLKLKSTIDLETVFKKLSSRNQIGAKKAASIVLNQKLLKSKNMSRSNWENENLSPGQLKYASEDATVVYDVMSEILKQYPFTINIMPPFFQKHYKDNK